MGSNYPPPNNNYPPPNNYPPNSNYNSNNRYGQQPPPYPQQGNTPYPAGQPPPSYQPYPPVAPGPDGTTAVREGYTNRPIVIYPAAQDVRQEGPVYQQGDMRDQGFEEDQRDPFAPSFMDKKIRQRFVAKVFAILGIQLLFTTAVISICYFVKDIRRFILRNMWIMLLSLVFYMVTTCVIVCCQNLRRRHPWNLILLGALTVAVSCLGATICALYSIKSVLIAAASTCLVVFVICIVSLLKLVDITKCAGILMILGFILLLYLLVMILTSMFVSPEVLRVMELVYAALATVLISLFLMFDLQALLGGRRIEISPEEYVLAASNLYVDVFTLFVMTLMLVGAATGDR